MIAENQPDKQPSGENVTARAWLDHIPAHRRGTVANWFHCAVRQGAPQPACVLQAVRQVCDRRRHWGDETDTERGLEALDTDRAGALAHAQPVIDYERLPYDARQRVQAERAFHYLQARMRGKAATDSAFIDALRQGRGRP